MLLLILKDIMALFCKKTFSFRSPFPLSFPNALRPDCPLRKCRGQQNSSENSEETESTEETEHPENSEGTETGSHRHSCLPS